MSNSYSLFNRFQPLRGLIRPIGTLNVNLSSLQAKGIVALWPIDPSLSVIDLTEIIFGNTGILSTGGGVWDARIDDVSLWSLSLSSNTTFSAGNSSVFASTPFSMSCWFRWDGNRFTGASTKDWMSPFAKGRFSSGEFCVLIHRDSTQTSTDINFYINGGSRATYTITNPGLDTLWHHLVVTYDQVTATIYLDGVSVATGSYSTIISSTSANLTIANCTTDSYFWGGNLADIRYYNIALSSAVIAQMYIPQMKWDLYGGRNVYLPIVVPNTNAAILLTHF